MLTFSVLGGLEKKTSLGEAGFSGEKIPEKLIKYEKVTKIPQNVGINDTIYVLFMNRSKK